MHIVECHFDYSGFDDRLVKAGTGIYLWNLSRRFRAAGHRVTALTPAHGLLPQLREKYEVSEFDWRASADLPVRLDPLVWPDFDEQVTLPVSVTAHRLVIDGIEIVLLAGGVLDEFPGSFYPPRELKGHNLDFLKPLVFQVMAVRFLADTASPGTVVHLHEPAYHYLMPAALAGRGLAVVSTVQTNLPVNKQVYGPAVRTLVSYLGGDPAVADGLADPPLDTPLQRAMRSFLPETLLYHDYPDRPGHDYISMLGLVVRSVQAMDFLSEGQLAHALTQAGTPFEQLFAQLAVSRELRAAADRLVVGGCAIGAEWLDVRRDQPRRERTLAGLGLDPRLPTVYHNGRYSPQHKGLPEMFRALRRLLDEGEQVNVLLHCLAPEPPSDPDLDALAGEHPALVRVRTGPMGPAELVDWAAASDLSLFPSKFEMDTFLMAMGEAMACGAVPIATAQQGMRHFRHAFDLDDPAATGLALPRSFRVDDPHLTDAIHSGLRRMLALVREQPERIETIRNRGIARARQFTWEGVAGRFLAIFSACLAGATPDAAVSLPTELRHRAPVAQAAPERPELAAHAEAAGVRVRGRFETASRVDAVLPGRPPPVVTLAAEPDGWFGGWVPGAGIDHLALLVTHQDGRVGWEEACVR